MSGGGFTVSRSTRILLGVVALLFIAAGIKGFMETFSGHGVWSSIGLFVGALVALLLGLVLVVISLASES